MENEANTDKTSTSGEVTLAGSCQIDLNDSGTSKQSGTRLTHENPASFFRLSTSRGPILVDAEDEAFVRQYNWYAVPAAGTLTAA